jgi:hypothetical protein
MCVYAHARICVWLYVYLWLNIIILYADVHTHHIRNKITYIDILKCLVQAKLYVNYDKGKVHDSCYTTKSSYNQNIVVCSINTTLGTSPHDINYRYGYPMYNILISCPCNVTYPRQNTQGPYHVICLQRTYARSIRCSWWTNICITGACTCIPDVRLCVCGCGYCIQIIISTRYMDPIYSFGIYQTKLDHAMLNMILNMTPRCWKVIWNCSFMNNLCCLMDLNQPDS